MTGTRNCCFFGVLKSLYSLKYGLFWRQFHGPVMISKALGWEKGVDSCEINLLYAAMQLWSFLADILSCLGDHMLMWIGVCVKLPTIISVWSVNQFLHPAVFLLVGYINILYICINSHHIVLMGSLSCVMIFISSD